MATPQHMKLYGKLHSRDYGDRLAGNCYSTDYRTCTCIIGASLSKLHISGTNIDRVCGCFKFCHAHRKYFTLQCSTLF